MQIRPQVKSVLDVAVFTRNHPEYLEEASKIGKSDPNRHIAFRAVTRWVSAAKYLRQRSPMPLYISSIGASGVVDFVADLIGISLDPSIGEPQTDQWLEMCLKSTKKEGLWDGEVGTLYMIANCRPIPRPFAIQELVKVSNNEKLSANYERSYSVVFARSDDTNSRAG